MAAWQMLLPVLGGAQGVSISGVFLRGRDLCGDMCRQAIILKDRDDGWMGVCEMESN
jgi:hypothetical protein